MASLPRMVHVRQRFATEQIEDLQGAIHAELTRVGLDKVVRPGMEVAITAGSRGISRIPEIIRTVVDAVKAAGRCAFCRAGHGQSWGRRGGRASLGIARLRHH